MTIETVKGFRDVEDCSKRNFIRKIIEQTFKSYNFLNVETPVIEYEEFVKGNNTNDEAVSDIFRLKDRGERKLALRYEFTFQLKRLANNKKLPYKRYQIGEVFRDEPVAGNRWRQFTQCDCDIIGSGIKDEAEILKIASEILGSIGIKFVINFNSRKLLNEILADVGVSEKNREQVIREIDKLDKLSEKEVRENLKKFNAEKALDIFKKPEKYFEKYSTYSEIAELKKISSMYKIKLNFLPYLARGLSYYNGSVFEIKSDLKETIAAGGSYLVNGIQASGISFGLDRLELISKIETEDKKVLLISLGEDKKAIELSDEIRKKGIGCSVMYGKPGKALDYANSYRIKYVIFVGEDEVKKKKYKLKDMASGKESMLSEKDLLLSVTK